MIILIIFVKQQHKIQELLIQLSTFRPCNPNEFIQYSYISNGILAWGVSSLANVNRLFRLQKRALRIINCTDYNAHTGPLFFKNKILKIKDIYLHQLGSFMYQSAHGSLPFSLNSLFTRNLDFHTYNTRQAKHLHLPPIRTSLAKKSIKFEGPTLWNALPKHLKSAMNLSVFKRNYRRILLNNYDDQLGH